MTPSAVPQPLRDTFVAWTDAGRPDDAPTRWSRHHWGKDLVPAGLEDTPLTRAALVERAKRVTADDRDAQRDAFLAAMIWGYGTVGYGPSRVRTMLAEDGFADQLAELTHVTLEQGGPAAFAHVREARKAGHECLKGLGGAFGTKYIYALTKAHPERGVAPVLDSVVRAWFVEHVPDVDVRIGDGWTYPHRYGAYVETLQAWGEDLGIPADDVERLIFLQREGQTGGTWQEEWLSATPAPGAADLLRMLGDQLEARGVGAEAAPHLVALAELAAAEDDIS